MAPYDVPYVQGREGVSDLQGTLYERLLESAGGLLVLSRAGVGKTREVAELARRLCDDEGWTACIAKGEGDARIDTPATFPDELRGRKLLFVFDDLHQRVDAGGIRRAPYLARLNSFIDFFAKKMAPGELYIIATARSEPRYLAELAFGPSNPHWNHFKCYELPEFTLSALRLALVRLAEAAGVDLNECDAQSMVANSDHTLRTILDNVVRAKRRNERLTNGNWLPTQGRSWEVRFLEASSRWLGVDTVYQALRLLREDSLPTRLAYVVGLGRRLRADDVTTAAKGLVDMGLLAFRDEVLDAFADEQLRDSLHNSGNGLPGLSDLWPSIIDTAAGEAIDHPEWSRDLLSLGSTLLSVPRYSDAERISGALIERGDHGSAPYIARGIARLGQGKRTESEEDFSKAIDHGGDGISTYVAVAYFARGLVRVIQQKWAEAEQDFDKAFHGGRDDAAVYSGRGRARVGQQKWSGAEEALSKAIELGQDDAVVYFARGSARVAQQKCSESEQDLNRAIERGQDDAAVYILRGTARILQKNWAGSEADLSNAIQRGPDVPGVYFIRGAARVMLQKWAEGEGDLSRGIEGGRDDAADYYYRGTARAKLRKWAEAEADFDRAIERGQIDPAVYLGRGVVRIARRRPEEAEQDFNKAKNHGQDDAAVHFVRGIARVYAKRPAEAEEDFNTAMERGRQGADDYFWRGTARRMQEKLQSAEEDFAKAIELGRNDAEVYFALGQTRTSLNRWAEAEEDLDAAILRDQTDARPYFARGVVRLKQGKFAQAEKDFDRAIMHGRNDAQVYYCRGVARGAQDKRTEAEEDYNQSIERGQADPDVYLKRGANRYLQQELIGAEEDISRGMELGQVSADLYLARAYIRIRLGRLAEAREDCERAEVSAPGRLSSHGIWGYLHIAAGEYDSAITRFQMASELDRDAPDYFDLGLALLLQGQFSESEDTYRRGLAAASAKEVTGALAEIDFWSVRHKERVESSEAKNTIARIRRELESAVKPDHTGG